MKFNRNDAKALTNAKELELYDDARPPKLSKHSGKDLKNLVKRSRTLRDKLRGVKKTQVRSTMAKSQARGFAPADRSKEKAEMFAEVHDIFVARLEKVETGEAKEAAKRAASKPTKTDKNIETRTERTSTKLKLDKVKKYANAPETDTKGKAKDAAKTKTAKSKSRGKDTKLASAIGPPKKRLKIDNDPVDPAQSPTGMEPASPQSTGRRLPAKAKVEQDRLARSGITKSRTHLSAVNKRNQAKRDSK